MMLSGPYSDGVVSVALFSPLCHANAVLRAVRTVLSVALYSLG